MVIRQCGRNVKAENGKPKAGSCPAFTPLSAFRFCVPVLLVRFARKRELVPGQILTSFVSIRVIRGPSFFCPRITRMNANRNPFRDECHSVQAGLPHSEFRIPNCTVFRPRHLGTDYKVGNAPPQRVLLEFGWFRAGLSRTIDETGWTESVLRR